MAKRIPEFCGTTTFLCFCPGGLCEEFRRHVAQSHLGPGLALGCPSGTKAHRVGPRGPGRTQLTQGTQTQRQQRITGQPGRRRRR